MATGFHPPPPVGIGDPDQSADRHHHHPPPPAASAPHTYSHHHIPPGITAAAGGGGGGCLFDSPAVAAAQRSIPSNPTSMKAISPSAATDPSDDDEDPSENSQDPHSKSKKRPTWHRMKWTDDTVRLLISIVSYVGDDGVPEAAETPTAARRRPGAALQKKGKWKAVSKLMLEKGCYVSPQQCEDKFNDLNKRYKRLNEILGRGTTCEVVENPAMLDSMNHVPPKAKEDVRKILSSKHLFYREMCAYHNGPRICAPHDVESQGAVVPPIAGSEDHEDGDEDDDDDHGEEEDDDGGDEFGTGWCDSLRAEMDEVLQDRTKSRSEQLEWMRMRMVHLQEERLDIEAEALEIARCRFKWQRFRSKKDREMERLRLGNERMMLKNECMILQVRQKEVEVEGRRNGDAAGFARDGDQGKDLMELTKGY